ncbi:MAG TPA: hypothetical protein DF296_15080 [Candidatus Margulisbacteria bacterium]|nr:hypothetical protein [Candidatus Margulisiibacteriota bacterium]
MTDETKVVYDEVQIGTCEDVRFEERRTYKDVENLISPESIQAMQNAFLTMQEALKSLGEALNEALVNAENENHETVTKLLEAYQTAREVKKREYDPEIIELAQTTIYRYDDCALVKYVFGDAVKIYLDLFAMHGFTSGDILKYCTEVLMERDMKETEGFSEELKDANEKLETILNGLDKKGNAEKKLSRKLRNGWA